MGLCLKSYHRGGYDAKVYYYEDEFDSGPPHVDSYYIPIDLSNDEIMRLADRMREVSSEEMDAIESLDDLLAILTEKRNDPEGEERNSVPFRSSGSSLKEVNKRYNERLAELDDNHEQKNRVLTLGRPGRFLKAGGVEDAEIIMEFDKFIRKSSPDYKNNHSFTAADIRDLPIAINEPIAVFDGADGISKVILTELRKDGRNFIVAVKATKQKRRGGVFLIVNQITTLYPKEARGIVHWLNTDRAVNIDKEKKPFVGYRPSSPMLEPSSRTKNFSLRQK